MLETEVLLVDNKIDITETKFWNMYICTHTHTLFLSLSLLMYVPTLC